MKPIRIINATALFLFLGIAAPAYARQEKPQKEGEKARPAQQQQQAKPERQQQAQAPRQQRQQQQAQAPRQQRQQQQAQAPKQQRQQQQAKGQQQQRQQQARSSQPPQRSRQEQDRQRAQPALRLSARGGGRIPDDRFRSHFGREHEFRIGEPRLVGGYSRFQYGGYWFGFVEPWPVGWYYSDDVYIDYVDGGYYMYDPYYPGARFAISVVI